MRSTIHNGGMGSTMYAGGMAGSSTNAGGGLGSTMYASGMTPVLNDKTAEKRHVSLTFKKFKQDSMKEHTRDILPNVTPAIKR